MTTQKQAMTLLNHNGFFGDANNTSIITKETAKADPILDWEVHKAFSYYQYKGNFYEQEGKYSLVRSDDPSVVLGYQVGEDYDILQNHELVDWVEPYLDRNYLEIVGYGYFQHGRDVFLQCRNSFVSKIDGDDIEHYFLIFNPHGHGSLQINFCTQRAICQNTLHIAKSQGNKIKIRHNQSMRDNLEMVHHRIDLAKEHFDQELEIYNHMTKIKMDKKGMLDTLTEQFSKELKDRQKKADAKGSVYLPQDYPLIKASLNNWDNLEDIQHLPDTAWKAWQAVNYNLNHGWGSIDDLDAKRRLWTGTYYEKSDQFKELALKA